MSESDNSIKSNLPNKIKQEIDYSITSPGTEAHRVLSTETKLRMHD